VWAAGRAYFDDNPVSDNDLAVTTHLWRHAGQPGIHNGIEYRLDSPVHLVHVGKAAGGTIKNALDQAGVPYDEQHMYSVRCDEPEYFNHKIFLVTVRDHPVDRFLSTYYWRGVHDKVPSPYDCCGTVDGMFGETSAVDYENAYTYPNGNCRHRMNCSRFRDVVLSQFDNPIFNVSEGVNDFRSHHTFQGYCYHVGGCLEGLEKRRVVALPTETLSEDLPKAIGYLQASLTNNTSSTSPWRRARPTARGDTKINSSGGNKTLSKSTRRNLEYALADEYRAVNTIIAMSMSVVGIKLNPYCTQWAKLSGVCSYTQ
jgi:hypothetical protein